MTERRLPPTGAEIVGEGEPAAPATDAQHVGEALRLVRRRKRLSLHDVEAATAQEFRASVLGAYERGERAISVPRLQRLSQFYGVSLTELFSDDGARTRAPDIDLVTVDRAATALGAEPVKIDLTKLAPPSVPDGHLLTRYLMMITTQRRGFHGEVLTIRSQDLRTMAALLDVSADLLLGRLVELGLLVVSAHDG
jgi:transcriptional regulator with XRE-family HTH domain